MCHTLPCYLYISISVSHSLSWRSSILGVWALGGWGWGGNHAVTKLGWRRVHGQLKRTRNSSTSFFPMANAAGELFLSLQVSPHLPFPHLYRETNRDLFKTLNIGGFLKWTSFLPYRNARKASFDQFQSVFFPPRNGLSFFLFSPFCLWSSWTLIKQAGFEFVLLSTFSFGLDW